MRRYVLRSTASLIVLVLLCSAAIGQPQVITGGPVFDDPQNFGPLSGTIHGSGTWLVPAGETLTVQAGTNIKFGGGQIGRIQVDGTLRVLGTGQSPVFFTSVRDDEAGGNTNSNNNPPLPGDWFGIRISRGAVVEMDNTTIRFALTNISMLGGAPSPNGEAILDLEDCTMSHAAFNALDCGGGFGDITLTTVHFSDNLGNLIHEIPSGNLPQLTGLTAADNANQVLFPLMSGVGHEISGNLAVSPANTFNNSGVLTFDGGHDITVNAGAQLTLAAGMIIKGTNTDVFVDGTILCNGTAGNPVVFTSFLDDTHGGDTNGDGNATVPGSLPGMRCRGIRLNSPSSSGSVLRHTIFTESAPTLGTVVAVINSSPTIEDCLIEKGRGSATDGLRCLGTAAPTVTRLTIDDVPGIAIGGVSLDAVPGFDSITAVNCASGDYMSVQTGLAPGFGDLVITPRNYPGPVLVLEQGFDVQAGDRVGFHDGVILKLLGFLSLQSFGGGLDFKGTPERPVIITKFDDDEIAGDTGKDGNAPSIRWRQIFYDTSAAPSVVEHLFARRFSNGLRFNSSQTTLRNTRLEPRGSVPGAVVTALGSAIDNLVVFYDNAGTANGLDLQGGNFDVRHCTVTGAGTGIRALAGWTGDVVNSIAFGNTTNISGLTSARVLSSIGAFDGVNGNLVTDPLFVDPVAGDLSLQPGSPAVDTADLTTALAVMEDHTETPRVLPSTPGGAFAADRGAFELATHRIEFTGSGQLGTIVGFNVPGGDVVTVTYVLSLSFQGFAAPPVGISLLGPVPTLLAVGPLPGGAAQFNLTMPNDPVFSGLEFGCQAVATVTAGASNAVVVTDMKRVRMF